MFSWRAMMQHFVQMRGYIAFTLVLFLAGIFVGASNASFEQMITGQIAGLQDMAQQIDQSSNPELTMFLFIFFNNAIKSILIIYLGLFFGVIPLAFILINGMVLGYLFANNPQPSIDMFTLIVKGILPHGIIEIPAIIIAGAYGIRFGVLSLKGIGALFKRDGSFGRTFEAFAARTVPLMVWLVVALLVAAIIESTVTVWLLSTAF
ncbi:stage II sporulation protein M [Paenibacillus daejeonensis]|uniref:stage II sporulation protein M n=1 Tax=Paenibacillus daejeonensis TaxID=135193 RepID=UPI00036CFF07|nr:stage II sporulation protein M [Paenibacillus daejeonensis]